jgi:hypothetical protein
MTIELTISEIDLSTLKEKVIAFREYPCVENEPSEMEAFEEAEEVASVMITGRYHDGIQYERLDESDGSGIGFSFYWVPDRAHWHTIVYRERYFCRR